MTAALNNNTPTFIRQVRQRAGLSLRSVARACGISAPYLYDVEMGHRGMKPEFRKQVLAAIKVLKEGKL